MWLKVEKYKKYNIAEALNILSTIYHKGFHVIVIVIVIVIAGDTNELNLTPILNLSPNLKQIVTSSTRTDPVTAVEKVLDPVIMTLGAYYQKTQFSAPLDPYPDSNGKPSYNCISETNQSNK